ncbi:hypothetical protein MMRN_02130 [Mycobacterium marinum]|nr:hypothetical protein MMRN_02130 [Mycobacterium marinum]
MLFAALRDMQWRKRRLVIAIISTGIIFGMTLVMTGLANGFRVEAQHTVDSLGVDVFVVKAGAAGPFLGSIPFPDVDVARVAAEPGVVAAAPLASMGTIMKEGKSTRNVTAFGAPEHGPGMPRYRTGERRPSRMRSRYPARSIGISMTPCSSERTSCGLSESCPTPRRWPRSPTFF